MDDEFPSCQMTVSIFGHLDLSQKIRQIFTFFCLILFISQWLTID